MSDIWYYADDHVGSVGPLTFEELRGTLATVSNAKHVLVWSDGFPDWKRAKDVPGLIVQAMPPPLPPRGGTFVPAERNNYFWETLKDSMRGLGGVIVILGIGALVYSNGNYSGPTTAAHDLRKSIAAHDRQELVAAMKNIAELLTRFPPTGTPLGERTDQYARDMQDGLSRLRRAVAAVEAQQSQEAEIETAVLKAKTLIVETEDLTCSISLSCGYSVADAAEIFDWNWRPEPTFASTGAILWDVQVRNTSSRDIRLVQVNFFTYDTSGNFVGSDSAPVISIPPGQMRVARGYADLHNTEATATVQMVDVIFERKSIEPLDFEWEKRRLADRKLSHFCRPDRAFKEKLAITAANLKRRWPDDQDCRDGYEEYSCAQEVMKSSPAPTERCRNLAYHH
jgi:hypothetical protein